MPEEEKRERIIVTVNDENLSMIESVVAALESAGMKVEQVLTITGIITGEVAQSKLEGLKSVPGVVDVEIDTEMQAI
ncbi:MAG: ketohydroxyglutarate aldolase [Microcoleus sp. SU_5_6]|nr:ketohydroxyglutarate aldolase [Microcoleus sp. SU_5_6]NJL66606.1 ketohydroxyglutarate aldolase [Microcoleus sp. SM1_3_4]